MENAINIKFWGVRGSTPCANPINMRYGGNTTCLQIELPYSDELLVLDCGTGFRNLGNTLQESEHTIKGKIFITHPHWDHLQGFPFFKPFYNSGNKFDVFIPPQGLTGCKQILQGHMSETFFPVSLDMLMAEIECETYHPGKFEFDNFSIEYIWANHTIPTAIYKIKAGGREVIFAPDNELTAEGVNAQPSAEESFRNFIHGADVLIHDAQFNAEQYETRQSWGHSSWESITALAKQEGVKNLYLTHHDPDSSDDYLSTLEEKIDAQYKYAFNEICLAKERQEIILPVENYKVVAG